MVIVFLQRLDNTKENYRTYQNNTPINNKNNMKEVIPPSRGKGEIGAKFTNISKIIGLNMNRIKLLLKFYKFISSKR